MLGKPKIDKEESQHYPDTVHTDRLVPNTWNPNKMSIEEMELLRFNMLEILKEAKKIPPLVVRPHPTTKKSFEIIDGEHRWRLLKELNVSAVPICVLDVDTKIAMYLTDTLNHLRGRNDPKKYAAYINLLMQQGEALDDICKYLPTPKEDIELLLQSQNIKIEDIPASSSIEQIIDEPKDEDVWLELKFKLSKAQAEIVEAEITRISSVLEGGNIRGRALEFIAVNSAQTPLKSITGEVDEEKPLKKKMKMVKR